MKPTDRVLAEIARFLASNTPEVLCIKGRWGVGKTFLWQTALTKAKKSNDLALSRYSYTSLFGLASLQDLKFAIVENLEFLIEDSSLALTEKLKRQINRFGKGATKWGAVAARAAGIGDAVAAAGPLFFSLVKDQIICVDDVERKSHGLAIKDILGLISFLKEERKCKVILILNDDELGDDGGEEFQRYFEKVVDIVLAFDPQPIESVTIALATGDDVDDLISGRCIFLGISNIRVIKKIERIVRLVAPLLANFDEEVLRQAVGSLALFAWSKYQPKLAPSLEFLRTERETRYLGFGNREEIPSNEAKWHALLDSYGFARMDEFDLILLQGLEVGYFDPGEVRDMASHLNIAIKQQKQIGSFRGAWDIFHASFDDNQEEVLDALFKSFVSNTRTIDPVNLNGTITLFKDLGRSDQAAEMLALYISGRGGDRESWDLASQPFSDMITDESVRSAFSAKFASFEVEVDPVATLKKLYAHNGWGPKDIEVLSNLSVEDFVEIFHRPLGSDLRNVIAGALKFERIQGVGNIEQRISSRAREALTAIGKESPINANRVQKFGIVIKE